MKRSFSCLSVQRLGAPEILNAMGDGVYVTNLSRKILFWNKAAERITGWSADEVVGRSCFDNILIHIDKDGHKLCGEEYCPLHRCIITGQASEQPLLVYAQNRAGKRVPVEVSVSPILNPSGRILGGIEVFRDLNSGFEDLVRAKMIQSTALKTEIPNIKKNRSIDKLENEIEKLKSEATGKDKLIEDLGKRLKSKKSSK